MLHPVNGEPSRQLPARHVPRGTLPNLLDDRESALQRLDEWNRGDPSQRWNEFRDDRAARTSEHEDDSPGFHEGLQGQQGSNFHPNGAQRKEIECSRGAPVAPAAPRIGSFRQPSGPRRASGSPPQKRRLSRFDLDHREARARDRQPHGNRRRPPAGSDVHRRRLGAWEVPGCRKRFQEQPVDGVVRLVERRQVDLAIPAEEKLVIRGKPAAQIVWEKQSRFCCTFDETRAEIPGRHAIRVSDYAECRGSAARPSDNEPQA